ncbi:MAG: coproporphyrinogen III oxidase, partial [Clostridia bacterium]|nr:coproporphyrinogen III oxidase [Clostridia bacterium]
IHKKDDFVKTVALAKEAGFSDINADIMYGLPGQMQEQYLETLRFAAEQGVTHVSAYSLILEEGTPLEHMVMQGKAALPNEDAVADMEDAGRELLEQLGYERYEISNYAKQGFRCRHNVNYWENGEWLGLGAAAHSAKGTGGVRVRAANTEDIQAYIRGKNERTEEKLTCRDEMFETVMLGLRMTDGLLLKDFENRFGSPLESVYPGRIAELKRNGWLNEYAYASGRLALNARGLDFENAAVLLVMAEQENGHG